MQYLSKEIGKFSPRKREILAHFERKGYSIDSVSDYCSTAGIPLVIVYQYMYEVGHKDALDKCKELCEYYDVNYDI